MRLLNEIMRDSQLTEDTGNAKKSQKMVKLAPAGKCVSRSIYTRMQMHEGEQARATEPRIKHCKNHVIQDSPTGCFCYAKNS